jgi:hypothetical protein
VSLSRAAVAEAEDSSEHRGMGISADVRRYLATATDDVIVDISVCVTVNCKA